jgi:hypothetical protein
MQNDFSTGGLIFGALFGILSICWFFITFKYFFKYIVQDKHCTERVTGSVQGYAPTMRSRNVDILLPVVYYTVKGRSYRVVGPEYRGYIVKTVDNLGKDIEIHEDTEGRLIVLFDTSTFLTMRHNPIARVYPLGSKVEVYYDPNHPKLAVAGWFCNRKNMFWLFCGVGCLLLANSVMAFFLL